MFESITSKKSSVLKIHITDSYYFYLVIINSVLLCVNILEVCNKVKTNDRVQLEKLLPLLDKHQSDATNSLAACLRVKDLASDWYAYVTISLCRFCIEYRSVIVSRFSIRTTKIYTFQAGSAPTPAANTDMLSDERGQPQSYHNPKPSLAYLC